MRIGVLGMLTAMGLSHGVPGWVSSLYANFPIPYPDAFNFLGSSAVSILKTFSFFFSLGITHYLFIAVPGTIVGDMILKWMDSPEDEESSSTWSKRRYVSLALLLFGSVVMTLCLLKGRYVWELAAALASILLLETIWYANHQSGLSG